MININLLIKPRPLVSWQLAARMAVALGLMGIVAVVTYGQWNDLQRLKSQVAETERLIADYNRNAARQKDVQDRLETIRKQRQALAEIGRNQRFSQAAILEAILVTPPRVTVTGTAFAGAEVEITGRAVSFADAMEYLAYLRSAPGVLGVSERHLRTGAWGETTFTFAARIRDEEGTAR